MMDCISIIQSVDRLGAELLLEGNHIRIKKGKYLPVSITASIGNHKREILAILERDNQAKRAGLMIAIPGELYTVTLNNVSSVYFEHIEDGWEARRETHYPHQSKAISSKIIAIGNTFEFALQKVKQYLDYIIKKREKT
ncbi:hypothetical protein COC61_11015 [Priestia megaterium]|uniref:hypothetical protein n=1 Tax=Priestia megaterium TaxID=1404 RepID=UPI000BFD93E7|nr:hypothetical protein [Priestia megaterium]PGR96900.1 hypothetical protein COC61_11015 [Priestia megaterium]